MARMYFRPSDTRLFSYWGTALEAYGSSSHMRRLGPAELAARRASLVVAWEAGPHPSQVQRRKDVRWARRWPMMVAAVGCGLLPVACPRRRTWFWWVLSLFRRAAPLPASSAVASGDAVVVDTACALPGVDRSTSAANRAYLQGQVLGNRDLLRQVAVFL